MGHKNYQEVDVSSTIIGSVTQTNYADCETYASGGNEVKIDGDNDVISGIDQTITLNVDMACVTQDPLNYAFSSRVQNSALQQLADSQVAMTQWMDNSKDSVSTNISADLELSVLQENSQNCMNSINANNTINVTGDNDVVKNITQEYSLDTITSCHMKDGVAFKASNSMTNTINQHLVYTSVNPFAFITDAIVAIADSVALLVAFCFIIFLCFIALFAILRHRSKSKQRAAAVAEGRSAASVH